MSKELIETRKFEITNRRNKKSFQPKELRSVDEEMQISNFPSKLQCFNKLFHQTRHISDYVTSLSFSLPQIESRRLLTLWHHSDWRFLLLLQSTSILTCNDVRHGYHCLSIYGFNSARALIGGWAGIMKIFSARQLAWVLSKNRGRKQRKRWTKFNYIFNNWKKNYPTSSVWATKGAIARKKKLWKISSGVFMVFFLRTALRKPYNK